MLAFLLMLDEKQLEVVIYTHDIQPITYRPTSFNAKSLMNVLFMDYVDVSRNYRAQIPDPSSRLATTDMGRKLGDCAPPPFGERELGPHLAQCGLSRCLPPCQVAS